MQSVSWSARQYVTFEDERTRPVRDLLAALPAVDARRAVDIGCGPGNSTELLAARFPGAQVSGIDSSMDMIEAARGRMPAVRFDHQDIESWTYHAAADRYDVILANAVLHWIPSHATLLPALIARLAAGGALAVQMPDNLEEPAHRLMREVAGAGPWAGKLAAAAASRQSLATADRYYEWLRAAGCAADTWRTTYYHPLAGGTPAVVEWFKGSGLRPFMAPLDEGERQAFLERYESALAGAYPPQPDGVVLLPFPRLFMVAQR